MHNWIALLVGVVLGTFFINPLVTWLIGKPKKIVCSSCRHIRFIHWPKPENYK